MKRKGGSIIDSDEDAQGEPEPKRWKVDAVPVVEIRQPATGSVSLLLDLDLIAVLRDHIEEQRKQTTILERIAWVQELDWEDWGFDGSEDSETEIGEHRLNSSHRIASRMPSSA